MQGRSDAREEGITGGAESAIRVIGSEGDCHDGTTRSHVAREQVAFDDFHQPSERFPWLHRRTRCFHSCGNPFPDGKGDRDPEFGFAAREVVVDHPRRGSCRLDDIAKAGAVVPLVTEEAGGREHHPIPRLSHGTPP
jgi:hypothetical protein